MLADTPDESWQIVNRHRLVRRGRKYGARQWSSACEPMTALTEFTKPGLMFVALNADIERQFEFIQQNWINDPGFAEMSDERDPLVGVREPGRDSFTMSAKPPRKRVSGLPDFVTVKGGEYFFLPGVGGLGRLLGACA